MNAALESVAERQPKLAADHGQARQQRGESAAARARSERAAVETAAAPGAAGAIMPGPTLAAVPVGTSTAALAWRPLLTAAETGEDHELEADRVAELFTRMPAPDGLSARRSAHITAGRTCAGCAAKGEGTCGCAQRKADPAAAGGLRPLVPAPAPATLGTGQALPVQARRFFEPRFGSDFSRVRVHTDHHAGELARQFGAHALTVGQHIVFGTGQFDAASARGRSLLAHELTHVVQQSESPGSTPPIQFKKAGPGSCGWLDEAASTTIGGAAHFQIQEALAGRGLVAEFPPIPRAIKTPSNIISPKCQPLGTAFGRPDLSRPSAAGMAISEIKPWWRASTQGRLEAVHYQRRARQSKQRLFHTGQCGTQPPGPDDFGFQADAGVTAASSFSLLKGAISGDQDFGVFSMDPRKNLFAREVGPGAIGYWCRLNEEGKRAKEEEEERKREEKERKREEKERKREEKERKKKEKRKGEKEKAEKEKAEKEKAEKEKAEKEKTEGSAGAANVGFGISIFSSSVGAGNAGVGISIASSSAAVGTAGAGISVFSDTAAAGAAGVGISKDSQAAGAGVAGAGVSSGSTAVAAGAAGAGTSKDVVSAGAGVATAGHAEESVGAAAGVAGKGDVSGSIAATAGAKTSGDVSGVVAAGTGSSTVAVDPRDVSGPGADRVPSGQTDAEVMAKDIGKPGATVPGSEGSQHPGGGTAPSGAGGGQAARTGTELSQSPGTPGARPGGPGMTSAGQRGGPAGPGTSTAGAAAPGPSTAGTTAGTTAGQQTGGGAGPGGGSGQSPAPGNLAVVPVIPSSASAADRQRLDVEAAKVAAMLQHAQDGQRLLLQYLASQSTGQQYVVPTSEWVAKLLTVTKGLSPEDIEYLKQLDWKPGHVTEKELRERIQKALANRKAHAGHDDPSSSGSEPSRGVGHKGGHGPHGPSPAAGGGREKVQQPSQLAGGGRDRASAPPPSFKHEASGASFGFVILSGITASSELRQGQAVDCTVRIIELDSNRTFVLEGVSITFDSRKDATTINVYFTHDFWSQKFGFHGLGGKETLSEYTFGKRKPGKR